MVWFLELSPGAEAPGRTWSVGVVLASHLAERLLELGDLESVEVAEPEVPALPLRPADGVEEPVEFPLALPGADERSRLRIVDVGLRQLRGRERELHKSDAKRSPRDDLVRVERLREVAELDCLVAVPVSREVGDVQAVVAVPRDEPGRDRAGVPALRSCDRLDALAPSATLAARSSGRGVDATLDLADEERERLDEASAVFAVQVRRDSDVNVNPARSVDLRTETPRDLDGLLDVLEASRTPQYRRDELATSEAAARLDAAVELRGPRGVLRRLGSGHAVPGVVRADRDRSVDGEHRLDLDAEGEILSGVLGGDDGGGQVGHLVESLSWGRSAVVRCVEYRSS